MKAWGMANQLYGAGGRAFLNVNMPGYDILDGAIDGGLDSECEFELELRPRCLEPCIETNFEQK